MEEGFLSTPISVLQSRRVCSFYIGLPSIKSCREVPFELLNVTQRGGPKWKLREYFSQLLITIAYFKLTNKLIIFI